MDRFTHRTILTASPGLVLSIPAAAVQDGGHNRLLAVINDLEDWQGWEPSCIVAMKCWAAWRMREALGLELPDPEYPKMHCEFQAEAFDRYRRSIWFERDAAEGKLVRPPELWLA